MTEPQTASGLMDQIHMLRMAKSQYEDTLVAVHAALDDTLGRDHRTRDDSAATSIRRLAADAERRGAVKALRIEALRGLEAVEKAKDRQGPFRDFAVHLMRGLSNELARRADAIESGEVTP